MCKRLVPFSMVAGSYKLSKAYIPVAILFFPRKRRLYIAHLKKWSSFTICHWCSSHLIGAMESIFTSINKISKKLIMLKWAYSCLVEIISGPRLLQFTAVYIHVTTMRHWCVKWCGPLTHCWNTTGGIPYISKSQLITWSNLVSAIHNSSQHHPVANFLWHWSQLKHQAQWKFGWLLADWVKWEWLCLNSSFGERALWNPSELGCMISISFNKITVKLLFHCMKCNMWHLTNIILH